MLVPLLALNRQEVEVVTTIENSSSVRTEFESVNSVMLLLTDRTAGLSVLADWMVIAKRLQDVPDLLTALAVCSPEERSIVAPDSHFDEA